jgi:hypothetical protein
MIRDQKNIMCEGQAISSADAASTNYINQGAAGDAYESLWFVVRSTVAGTGAGTIVFKLQTATDSAFTTPIDLYTSASFVGTALTANSFVFKTRVPVGVKQYLRTYFDVTGTITGTFDAFLVADVNI